MACAHPRIAISNKSGKRDDDGTTWYKAICRECGETGELSQPIPFSFQEGWRPYRPEEEDGYTFTTNKEDE